MLNVLLILILLSFLVIIHELGHYFVAKKFGVNVEEFGFGYPPRILKLFKIKETIFSLNAIPFGGFVKLEGEEEAESKDAENKAGSGVFFLKSMPARIAIILAGPVVNLLFGMVAFSVVFSIMGIPVSLNNQPRIQQIIENSPAAKAGLPAEVNILAFSQNGQTTQVKTIDEVQSFVASHLGQEVEIITSGSCQQQTCLESASTHQIYLRTEKEIPAGEGSMGVIFSDSYLQFYPWYEMPWRAMIYGITQALSMGLLMLVGAIQLFANLAIGKGLPVDVAGPVGIAHQAQQSNLIGQGWASVLGFMGMLSINLGVMNALPIPALDGGRIFMILMEKIIGKSRVQKIEGYINYGGFIALIGLVLFITFKDIIKIIHGS